nr:unnamed protein product [Callosobruchus chinensis]
MIRCDRWAETRLEPQLELGAVVRKRIQRWRILRRMVRKILRQKEKDERMHKQQYRNCGNTEDQGVPTLNL